MESMDEIFRRHARTVYRFLLAKTGSSDLAEEMMQETFVRAVEHYDSYQGQSGIATWLCGIARNIWLDSIKASQKQKMLEADLKADRQTGWSASAEEYYFQKESHLDLLRSIHSLPEPGREVVYLRLSGHLSYQEIAQIMGHTENWARVTFYRAKEKLTAMLEEKEAG